MKKILFIFGTRPEVIKLAPIILELKKYPDKYDIIICNTEQQKELSNQTLSFFNIKSDINLDAMSNNQTLFSVQVRILERLSNVFSNYKFDTTIVQGDTMSVLCGALSSFYSKTPIFHVEAGLRSNNLSEPFPEEAIRQMVSKIANIHFAPTEIAKNNLINEGICEETIFVVGNTVIDALNCLSEKSINNSEKFWFSKGIDKNDNIILVTIHRRENHGDKLKSILNAIKSLSNEYNDYKFVIPMHPNPNVKNVINDTLKKLKNVLLLPPLDYPEFVQVMKNSKLILTDSGGIQEEAPTFGVPILVLRNETERIEGVRAGLSKLVGTEAKNIISETKNILTKLKQFSKNRSQTKNPYGDGKSAQRIENIMWSILNG